MLAYLLRMDLGLGYPTPLFSACGPCGGGCGSGCLDKAYLGKFYPKGQPYYVGDTWNLRLKVEEALSHAALDLTNWLIIATFKRSPFDWVGVVRRSDTDITDTIPLVKQIAKDTQTTDNGMTGTTGRGWFQFNFASVSSELCQWLSLVGDAVFDIRLQNTVTGEIITLLTWCLTIYEPRTLFTTPLPPAPIPGPSPAVGVGTYSCPSTVAVGDIVYLSTIDTVDKASASSSATSAWGVVLSKPSSFSALVLFAAGEVALYSGLTPMAQYYLNTTAGGFTTDVSGFVAGNIVQRIGRAKNATTMVSEIDNEFIVL